MLNSFRFRLAVWSALLAGIALLGFMTIAWWQIRDIKIAALDKEIFEQAERELSRPWSIEHWQHHEQTLDRIYGNRALLLVSDRRGQVFHSEQWPEALAVNSLAWPTLNSNNNQPPPPPPEFEPEDNRDFDPHRPPYGYDRPPLPPPHAMPPPFGEPPPRPSPMAFTALTLKLGNEDWRFGLATNFNADKLAVGINLALLDADMQDLRNAFLLSTPLALGFIGFGAWLLSGRALKPIKQLSKTMDNLTAKGLDQRMAFSQEDCEFKQLIQVFNTMLERLERSFLQASRFSGDAAHELKTPLAILQGQIERAINQCELGSEMQSNLTEILDEVQRLSIITRKLLLLSLADAGRLRLNKQRFDLSKHLAELFEDTQMLAPKLKVTATLADNLTILADTALLEQVFHNLISNAIKYNIQDGWLEITAINKSNHIEIAVINSSLTIAECDKERIFERFFRIEQSHNRKVDGVGLGLSLAREIIKAHKGELSLDNSIAGQTRFVINVPILESDHNL